MNISFDVLVRIAAALIAAVGVPPPACAQRIAPVRQQADHALFPLSAEQQLADHRRIEVALASLKPQRPGTVDAYVIVAALDSDPVFSREAREAGKVLARRFDAAGRTVVLAEDEGAARAGAVGSPQHLALALARAAELMDRNEDVLILYTTSHGSARTGLNYRDARRGEGVISPLRLARLLDPLAFRNRLLMLQACFSGQFVPVLAGPGTIVATASAADRSSFGCSPGNDWTFFGHALVNHALRRPEPFAVQFSLAAQEIAGWEARSGMAPSNPQLSVGAETSAWLDALEARAPKDASPPVGRAPSEIAR